MKIELIGQIFDKNSGEGIYKYSDYLYENLRKLNKDTEKIEIRHPKKTYEIILNNTLGSLIKTINLKADIYHFMTHGISLPCVFKKPSIVTVHDLTSLLVKERKENFNRYFYFKFLLGIGVKKAKHIIVVSEATKKDLIKIFNVPEEKISVIYLGVDHKKLYPLEKKRHEKFVIGYLGSLGKRKNVGILLKVAKKLENENVIFIVGGKGPEKEKLEIMAKKLKLNNVKFVGFIPEDKLNEYYNSLDLFIYPSLYEGFGLPVLEAMSCGVPVITSTISSLPEVVGKAGILINPTDVDDITKAIKKVIENKNLQNRMRLDGINQAKKFSWEKCAKETLKVYEGLQ